MLPTEPGSGPETLKTLGYAAAPQVEKINRDKSGSELG